MWSVQNFLVLEHFVCQSEQSTHRKKTFFAEWIHFYCQKWLFFTIGKTFCQPKPVTTADRTWKIPEIPVFVNMSLPKVLPWSTSAARPPGEFAVAIAHEKSHQRRRPFWTFIIWYHPRQSHLTTITRWRTTEKWIFWPDSKPLRLQTQSQWNIWIGGACFPPTVKTWKADLGLRIVAISQQICQHKRQCHQQTPSRSRDQSISTSNNAGGRKSGRVRPTRSRTSNVARDQPLYPSAGTSSRLGSPSVRPTGTSNVWPIILTPVTNYINTTVLTRFFHASSDWTDWLKNEYQEDTAGFIKGQ